MGDLTHAGRLTLTRHAGQSVVISTADGPVVVTVLNVRRTGTVRLGFEADRHIRILRSELLESGPRHGTGA